MNYGFIRAAAASLKLKAADPEYNKEQIKAAVDCACKNDVRILVTPELSVTGYTCADLFFTRALQKASEKAVNELAEYTRDKNIVLVVGAPICAQSKLFNCAVVLNNGEIVAATAKKNLANYNEFYEKRWFCVPEEGTDYYSESLGCEIEYSPLVRICDGVTLGIELCEDLWVTSPPSERLALAGANIIANLSASDEYVSKAQYRKELVKSQSARCICAYVYSGASVFESTTDLVFSGATLIAENGSVIAEGKRFSRENVVTAADIDYEKLNILRQKNMSFAAEFDCETESYADIENEDNDLAFRFVDSHPFVPSDDEKRRERCEEIFAIQSSGLAKRIEHVGSKGCIVGISGGLDSTLALLVCVEAMKLLKKPLDNIIGVTMPGFGTTDRTYNNAIELMKSLGVTIKQVDIKAACLQHLKDISHSEDIHDVTYENTQARERTQILFDLANKYNCLLVGTGDLSELAMGWCTYNGDHMSMYGVNASVPKTLVRYLVEYAANVSDEKTGKVLFDVLDTPVSPELLPPDKDGKIAQKTEDNIGPYELHDFFLYNFVRFGFTCEKILFLAEKAFGGKYDKETINTWLIVFIKRFFVSQFKRSCIPDSPKVGTVSLSPRGDWRMPSDASFNIYLTEDKDYEQ